MSDENYDGWMNRTEFISFVNYQSNGYFSELVGTESNFVSLPDIIQLIFNKIAICDVLDCMMGDGKDNDYCCGKDEKKIDVSKTDRFGFLSMDHSVLLYSLCSNIYSIVNGLFDDKKPASSKPTATPFVDVIDSSLMPSESPSMGWMPLIVSSVEKSTVDQEQKPSIVNNTSMTRSPMMICIILISALSCVFAFLMINSFYQSKSSREKQDIQI